MCNFTYIFSQTNSVCIDGEALLNNEQLGKSIQFCNDAIHHLYEQTKEFQLNIFQVLGMRNLSGLIGEYFARSVQIFSNDNLRSNAHEDGIPDLCLVNTQDKKDHFDSITQEIDGMIVAKDKDAFSHYAYGGVEVKATCGDTPPASERPKPVIGEQRIEVITKFNWKAHHRETNNLLGIVWDFINHVPVVVACFYCSSLDESDWAKLVQPKNGGGRTTSVSIMKTSGVKKMCAGWLAVIDDEKYLAAFAKKKWIGYRVS